MPSASAAPPSAVTVTFASTLARYGDRVALVTDDGALSYADLAARVQDMGRRLGTERRLVLVSCANDIDPLVTYLAALAHGHPVLLVPGDGESDHESLIATYDPDVVMGCSTGQWQLDERRQGSAHDLHPDLALLLCTSGSTGSPKLVRLSHRNVAANAESIAAYLDIRGSDRAVTTLPMQYCYGLSVINSHLLRGGSLVLTDLSVVEAAFWDLFRDNRCTSFAGVPYTFDLLDRIGFPDMMLPHLRHVTQAGGRLSADQVRRYARLAQRDGWQFFVMYGQTEATARMAYLPPQLAAQHPEAIGIPVPGGSFELRPIPESQEPNTGELVYSGPNVMLGYAETRSDLSIGRTVDVLETGDIARRCPDGLFELIGRRNRFVKIVGLRVDLAHAEVALGGHGICVACVGNDDELVVAHDDGYDPRQIRRLVAAEFGLPRSAIRVCRLPQLPRSASGKLDYRAVSERTGINPASAPASCGPATAPPPAADAEALRTLFAELLDRPTATLDSTFVSLGGDSLSYVEMSVRLEQVLGQLPTDWHTTPVRDLSPAVRRRRKHGRVIETSVVLRAVAILLIVGTHAQLFNILGSAHVLIAVAGFNFARFQLTSASRRERLRSQLVSILRIAVPSILWITIAFLLTEKYRLANVFLLNAVLGSDTWNQRWHFWFVEVLLYLLVGMAALLAIPWVDRAERRHPFGFVLTVVGLALLSRYELVDFGVINTKPVLWLFALGWASARARSRWQRLAVTAAVLGTVPGFFGDPTREVLMIIGLALLLWIPGVRCPAMVGRVAAVLASSSLFIYLTHWQVYPYLPEEHPLLAVLASVLVGLLYWQVFKVAAGMLARRFPRREATQEPAGRLVGQPGA